MNLKKFLFLLCVTFSCIEYEEVHASYWSDSIKAVATTKNIGISAAIAGLGYYCLTRPSISTKLKNCYDFIKNKFSCSQNNFKNFLFKHPKIGRAAKFSKASTIFVIKIGTVYVIIAGAANIIIAKPIYERVTRHLPSFIEFPDHSTASIAMNASIAGAILSRALMPLTIIADLFMEDLHNSYKLVVNTVTEKTVYELAQKSDNEIVTFKNIAGRIPHELLKLKDLLKNIDVVQTNKLSLPNGILLFGAPGTGKTALVKALVNEINANLFYVNALPIDTEEKSLTKLRLLDKRFDEATTVINEGQFKISVIFIDEIDLFLASNSANDTGTDILALLLTKMDGLLSNKNCIVIAATNNIQDIDQRLCRSGRFDIILEIPLPNKESRKNIISYYLAEKQSSTITQEEIDNLADNTENFSVADLKSLCDEAGCTALLEKNNSITNNNLLTALETLKKRIELRKKIIN